MVAGEILDPKLEARGGIGRLAACDLVQFKGFSEVTNSNRSLLNTPQGRHFGVRFGVRLDSLYTTRLFWQLGSRAGAGPPRPV